MDFRYPPAARWLHWITVALVVVMFTFGIWIGHFEPKDEALKLRLYAIHESTGVVVFVLVVELLNTAIEKLADRVNLAIDPQIGRVKDMGSAAVGLALLIAGITWLLALAERLGLI